MAEDEGSAAPDKENFGIFLEGISAFASAYSTAFVSFFEEDSRPEVEYVRIQMETLEGAFRSITSELQAGYDDAENETKMLLVRHVRNTGAVQMLRSSTAMFARKGVLGFLDKVAPILEIVKKLIKQIVDLFPKFLAGILDKIIIPLMELLDNIVAMILDLFGSGSGTRLMVAAEHRFLDAHPKWRNLYFTSHPDRID